MSLNEELDYLSLLEYGKQSKEFSSRKNFNKNFLFLITHHKLTNMLKTNELTSDNLSRIIFDEDPFKAFFPMYTFHLKQYYDFVEEINYLHLKDPTNMWVIKQFLNGIFKKPNQISDEFPLFEDDKELQNQLETIKYGHLVYKLLKSDFIIYNARSEAFVTIKKNIPKKGVINKTSILSATLDPFFYRNLFPENEIRLIEAPNIENQVPIVQYTENAFFKSFFRKKNLNNLPNVKNTEVITYKNIKKYFPNNINELHFGNLEGLNVLENKDLTIIGSPVPNVIVSILYAKILNLKFEGTEKASRWIEIDNFKFKIYTFTDENLAQIEIRLGKAMIEQAVGRARAIRNNVSVTIYSKIPCKYTDVFNPTPKGTASTTT